MTAFTRWRGHPVRWDEDAEAYLYEDGVIATWGLDIIAVDGKPICEDRPCKGCGAKAKEIDRKYPDPCIGMLPDVDYACCGHGIERCYVVWEHGVRTYGEVLSLLGATHG